MRTLRLLELSLPMLIFAAAPQLRAATDESLTSELRRCATISEPSARLACYDDLAGTPATWSSAPAGPAPAAAAPAPAGPPPARIATPPPGQPSAASSPTLVPAPAPGAPSSPASDFGVRNGPLQAKREPPREKKMLAAVSRVSSLPRGELVLTLDNGQIWVQLEARNFPVKVGDQIEIDEGALGSYILWSPSTRHASKVTRIN